MGMWGEVKGERGERRRVKGGEEKGERGKEKKRKIKKSK